MCTRRHKKMHTKVEECALDGRKMYTRSQKKVHLKAKECEMEVKRMCIAKHKNMHSKAQNFALGRQRRLYTGRQNEASGVAGIYAAVVADVNSLNELIQRSIFSPNNIIRVCDSVQEQAEEQPVGTSTAALAAKSMLEGNTRHRQFKPEQDDNAEHESDGYAS
nr:hypothetical protein Iba_chr05eCG9950 [Ipomoea batatas]